MAQAQRTLQNLIDAIRQNANEEAPNPTLAFVTDVEITRRIVEAQYELYDLMLEVDPYNFALSASFTLTSSNIFALGGLPDPGFYRLLGLDYGTAGSAQFATVHRFNFAERNRYSGQNFAGTYQIWYVPRIAELSAVEDKLDVFSDNFQKYIIARATIDVMGKAEESDPQQFIDIVKFERARILGAIMGRNQETEQVPDVTSVENWDVTGQLRGWQLIANNLVIR